MKTNDLAVNELFSLRELDVKTREKYMLALNRYCTEIEPVKMPEQLIEEALEEEVAFPPIHESNRKMTKRFMKFKAWVDEQGWTGESKIVTFSSIKTFYRDLGVKITEKMKFKVKVEKQDMIEIEDLPSKDDLLRAYHATNLRTKAIILLGLSSGLSGIDIRYLKVFNLMPEFKKYGINKMDIDRMYQIAQENEIIPMLDGKRKKNGNKYRTFCSPEAVRAIMNFLRQHPPKNEDDYVFRNKAIVKDEDGNTIRDENGNPVRKYKQLNDDNFFRVFTRLNERIGFGDRKREGKVLPHSLRRLFASLAIENDVSFVKTEFMLGHDLPRTQRSYYKQMRPDVMREAYLTIFPSVTLLEDSKVHVVTDSRLAKLEEEVAKNKEENEKLKTLIKAKTDWEKVEEELNEGIKVL